MKITKVVYHRSMNNFLFVASIVLFLLASAACNSEIVALPGEIDSNTTSPVSTATPTTISTAITIVTITAVPELPTSPIPTVTPTSSPTAIVSDVPKPHNLPVALSEIEQVRFVNTDTIAYLQWGTVYTHNLSTQQSGVVVGSGDISSFDWSDAQQQFVVVQDNHLYLLDMNGTLVKNLASTLPVIHPNPEFVKACYWNEMTENDNLLEYVKWVRWNPVDPNIIFGAANIDDYITHHCGPKIWSANIEENQLTEIGRFTNYNPEPQWLNKDLLLLDYYTGGGSHVYSVVNIPSSETIFEFGTYAGFTEASASGNRLVNVSELQVELQAWETSTGNELWQEPFPFDTVAYRNAWSFDERYIVVSQGENLLNTPSENSPPIALLVFDVEAKQKLQFDYQFFGYTHPTWLPNRNEILVFNRTGEDANIFIANPKDQTVELVSVHPNRRFVPNVWSSTNRYLPLIEGASDRSIWLFDNQAVETPSLIYELDSPDRVAQFNNLVWSSDDMWLIFTERSGPSMPDTDHADITLQALHISTGQHHSVTVWDVGE
jgi:hypothetical protein